MSASHVAESVSLDAPSNPYECLGVQFDATDDEIKSAYRKLVLKCVLTTHDMTRCAPAPRTSYVRTFRRAANSASLCDLYLYAVHSTTGQLASRVADGELAVQM